MNDRSTLNTIPHSAYELEKRNPNKNEISNVNDMTERLSNRYNQFTGSNATSIYQTVSNDTVLANKYMNTTLPFNPTDNRVGALTDQEWKNGRNLAMSFMGRNNGTNQGYQVPIRNTAAMDNGPQGMAGVMPSAQGTMMHVQNMEFMTKYAANKDFGIDNVGGKTRTPYLAEFPSYGDYEQFMPRDVVADQRRAIRKTRKLDPSSIVIGEKDDINAFNYNRNHEVSNHLAETQGIEQTFVNAKGERVFIDRRMDVIKEHADGEKVHENRHYTYHTDRSNVGDRSKEMLDTEGYHRKRRLEDINVRRHRDDALPDYTNGGRVMTGNVGEGAGRRVGGRRLQDRELVDEKEGRRTGRLFTGPDNSAMSTGYQPIKSDGIKKDREQFLDTTLNVSEHGGGYTIHDDRSLFNPNYKLGLGDVHYMPKAALQATNVGSRPQDYSIFDGSTNMKHNDSKAAHRYGQDSILYEHRPNITVDMNNPAATARETNQRLNTGAYIDRGAALMNLNHPDNYSPEQLKVQMMNSLRSPKV